jgi:protease-4
VGLGLGLLALFAATNVFAADPVQRPVPLPAIGRTAATNPDSTTIVQNPANLGVLPGAELRWTGEFLDDRALIPSQGNAVGLAFPIPYLPLATGLRYDMVNPPEAASRQMFLEQPNVNYQWLTWALALGTDSASLGMSLQRSYSNSALAHGFGSWSAGGTIRPSDYFAAAVVANNINGPTSDAGERLGPSYVLSGAIRPLGTDFLELGIEGQYIDEEGGYWVPRAVLDVGIPELGRIRGDFEVSDPSSEVRERAWLASANLVLFGNAMGGSFELSGGTRFGDALGDQAKNEVVKNVSAEVAVRAFRENTGAENLGYAVRIRLESTPNTRQHVALLRRLWSLADDEDQAHAVVLELRAKPAESLAQVQELVDAIYYLREKGKVVVCHLEDASGSALYACAGANRILINPAGGIRFAGLSSTYLYFKDLLDKLGIRADFVRIGEHKSAPEAFVRSDSTKVSRADKIDLMGQIERELTWGISTGRKIPPEKLRKTIAKGPFVSAEAKRDGLVDGYAFDDMLEDEVKKLTGQDIPLLDDKRAPRREQRFGPQQHVAVIYVDGDMVDGRSKTYPFIGVETVGSYTIAEALKNARENPMIGAVVLRVETGGGSAMAADVIWRQVQLTATRKPVIVSMGSAAASGGYYISAPGTRIFANPLTITGSIGIFYGKADIAELLRKIGVNAETYKTAPRADAESIYRPYTPEEKAELKRKVRQFYGMFLRRVADGRKMTKEQVDVVARGRVWTGRQAKERGLVDELGGLRQALAYARSAAGMLEDSPIIEWPEPDQSFVGKILGIEGVHAEVAAETRALLPGGLLELTRAVAPFALYDGNQPLARIEVLPLGLP